MKLSKEEKEIRLFNRMYRESGKPGDNMYRQYYGCDGSYLYGCPQLILSDIPINSLDDVKAYDLKTREEGENMLRTSAIKSIFKSSESFNASIEFPLEFSKLLKNFTGKGSIRDYPNGSPVRIIVDPVAETACIDDGLVSLRYTGIKARGFNHTTQQRLSFQWKAFMWSKPRVIALQAGADNGTARVITSHDKIVSGFEFIHMPYGPVVGVDKDV